MWVWVAGGGADVVVVVVVVAGVVGAAGVGFATLTTSGTLYTRVRIMSGLGSFFFAMKFQYFTSSMSYSLSSYTSSTRSGSLIASSVCIGSLDAADAGSSPAADAGDGSISIFDIDSLKSLMHSIGRKLLNVF